MDESILEAMAQYDETYEGEGEDADELMQSVHLARPATADRGDDSEVYSGSSASVKRTPPSKGHICLAPRVHCCGVIICRA